MKEGGKPPPSFFYGLPLAIEQNVDHDHDGGEHQKSCDEEREKYGCTILWAQTYSRIRIERRDRSIGTEEYFYEKDTLLYGGFPSSVAAHGMFGAARYYL